MHAIVKIILGILLVVGFVFVAINFSSWGKAVIELLKGFIVICAILAGIVFIVLGISELSGK